MHDAADTPLTSAHRRPTNSSESGSLLQQLTKVYQDAESSPHIRLEIVFVPVDRTEEEANDCFKNHGYWYALPLDETATITELMYAYDVSSSPSLVVIKKDGKVISRLGAEDIARYGSDVVVAWMY